MTTLAKNNDSDSTHSPIDDKEKVVGVDQGGFETLGHGELPPDPDAGLSEEEKARIVCILQLINIVTYISLTDVGPQTPPPTRPPPDPLALPPLPHLLPRPHQHRQRQTRRPPEIPPHHQRPIQRLPVHLLRLLRSLRAPHQRPAQAPSTEHFHPDYYVVVGDRDGDDGVDA